MSEDKFNCDVSFTIKPDFEVVGKLLLCLILRKVLRWKITGASVIFNISEPKASLESDGE